MDLSGRMEIERMHNFRTDFVYIGQNSFGIQRCVVEIFRGCGILLHAQEFADAFAETRLVVAAVGVESGLAISAFQGEAIRARQPRSSFGQLAQLRCRLADNFSDGRCFGVRHFRHQVEVTRRDG